METLSKYLLKAIELFIFITFSVMVVVVFLQVVFRYLFGFSVSWVSELSQYGMVWLCFLGAAIATHDRDHTRVDYFINLLPRALFPLVNVVINLILIAFLAYLSYSSIPIIKASLDDVTPGLGIPYGYVVLALPAGGVLMVFYLIVDSLRWLRQEREILQ